MNLTGTPLNGTKTHPLTKHARRVLSGLASGDPVPTQSINAGVLNRFWREALTETVQLPSPYAIHKGGTCRHERITAAGRAALAGS
jgi:hypothetical protein